MARIKNWTKLNAQALWEVWVDQFASESEAIDTALWCGNRLVKDKAKSTRRKFYSIKDAWIERHQKYLVTGQRVREEFLSCHACEGTGVRGYRVKENRRLFAVWTYKDLIEKYGEDGIEAKPCLGCNGSGKYRTWWLYLHTFDIEGQHYSFHSYIEPCRLDSEQGEDKESYGGRFTDDELKDMALPMSGLLKILSYVAAAKWDLELDKRSGKYY